MIKKKGAGVLPLSCDVKIIWQNRIYLKANDLILTANIWMAI